MKKVYLIIITLFFVQLSNASYGQSDNQLVVDTIIKIKDFTNEQWRSWDSINEYWLKNEFKNCLKQSNMKLNCANCNSVYLVVNLYIDNEGKLNKYEIVKESVCWTTASELLKKCFLAYFETIIFPVCLHKMNIQVRLGNGLKC